MDKDVIRKTELKKRPSDINVGFFSLVIKPNEKASANKGAFTGRLVFTIKDIGILDANQKFAENETYSYLVFEDDSYVTYDLALRGLVEELGKEIKGLGTSLQVQSYKNLPGRTLFSYSKAGLVEKIEAGNIFAVTDINCCGLHTVAENEQDGRKQISDIQKELHKIHKKLEAKVNLVTAKSIEDVLPDLEASGLLDFELF
jgi:hypothetical protein